VRMLTNTHFHGLVKLADLFINDRQFAVFSNYCDVTYSTKIFSSLNPIWK